MIEDRTKQIINNPYNCVYTFDFRFNLTSMNRDYYDFTEPVEGKLYDLIDEAVKNRLKGHEDITLFLSGGLDSSIIRHHIGENEVHSLCVDNKEDLDYAFMVDKEVEAVDITYDERALIAMESPIDLGSLYPQYSLCKSAPTTVIITGDGADEVFGGYRRMKEYDSQMSDVFSELPYYHLPRLDRISMFHTKELRSPFLSLKVVRYGLSLPYKERMDKSHLRECYRGILPDEIVDRPKEPLKANKNKFDLQYRRGLYGTFTSSDR